MVLQQVECPDCGIIRVRSKTTRSVDPIKARCRPCYRRLARQEGREQAARRQLTATTPGVIRPSTATPAEQAEAFLVLLSSVHHSY